MDFLCCGGFTSTREAHETTIFTIVKKIKNQLFSIPFLFIFPL